MMSRAFAQRAHCAFACRVLVCTLTPAVDAIPLLTGFGGPTGYGLPEYCVYPNDDRSYAGSFLAPTTAAPVAVGLVSAFSMRLKFFGNVYNSMYVNTNGNITFRGALPTYTPRPFPVATQPTIGAVVGRRRHPQTRSTRAQQHLLSCPAQPRRRYLEQRRLLQRTRPSSERLSACNDHQQQLRDYRRLRRRVSLQPLRMDHQRCLGRHPRSRWNARPDRFRRG